MSGNNDNTFFERKNLWTVVFSFFIFLLFSFQMSNTRTSTSQKFKTLQFSEVLYRNCCNKVSIASYEIKKYDNIELSCENAEIIQDTAKEDRFTIIPKSGNKVIVQIKSNKMLIGTAEWKVVPFEPKVKWFLDTIEIKNKIITTRNKFSFVYLNIEFPPNMDDRENQITVNTSCSFKPSVLSNWVDRGSCNFSSSGRVNRLFVGTYLTNPGSAYSVRIRDMYIKNCKNQKLQLPNLKSTENSAVVVLQ